MTNLNGCAKDLTEIKKDELCGVILRPYPISDEAKKAYDNSPEFMQVWTTDNEILYSTFCEGKEKWIIQD
jgi:hypothetical protein